MRRLIRHKGCEFILFFLCIDLVFFPILGAAKPIHKDLIPPSVNSLPVLVEGQTQSGWSTTTDEASHYLEVNQTSTKVIIQWQSFDIGSKAHTHFEQPENGTALNRIYDNDPSQIFGRLTATGNIYLINQNGILFGQGSRVNLNSLVASSLNIQDDEFINSESSEVNAWHFTADNYMNDSLYTEPGDVVNRGSLISDYAGRIFLLGDNVENSKTGTISSEGGWVVLAGGSEFDVESETDVNDRLVETISADCTGNVVNASGGKILADVGKVGIYGQIVRHDGLIRALSTVQTGSSIKLVASEKVTTGKKSVINSGVQELDEEIQVEEAFLARKLSITTPEDQERAILVALYGDIVMPAGDIKIDAGDGGRIYMGSGASIDVSGSWEFKQVEDLIMSAQLNSIELRDEFIQKNGILLGEKVYFLITEGISIGNISEHLDSRILSAKEASAYGGTVEMNAGTGDIIIDKGASIDFSGGGVLYEGGYVTTSKLMSDGIIYDISEAPDYLEYDMVLSPNDEDDAGSTYKIEPKYIPTFTEGKDAGKLTMIAKQIAYEGSMDGSVIQGLYQVNLTDPVDELGYKTSLGTVIPTAGSLQIGSPQIATLYYNTDPVVDAIVIKDRTGGIQSDFDPESSVLSSKRKGQTWLSDDLLSKSGLGNISLSATESIVTEANTEISLSAGGSLQLVTRRILHQGDILVPGGDVSFTTVSNKSGDEFIFGTEDNNPDYVSEDELGPERIELAKGSSIVVAGEQIDNLKAVLENGIEAYKSTAITEGGSIKLLESTNTGEGVILRKGALLDVSGGYMIGFDRKLDAAGDAGSIDITGPAIVLDGQVNGHSMLGQNGGEISLHAYAVDVVRNGARELPEGYSSEDSLPDQFQYGLTIDDNRFDDTGFTQITLSAYSDLSVQAKASLSPSTSKLTLNRDGRVSKIDLGSDQMAYIGETKISLNAGDTGDFADTLIAPDGGGGGTITIGKNAKVKVAPGGEISVSGQNADISGIFTALAGNITMNAQNELLIRAASRFYAYGFNRESGFLGGGDQIIWDPMAGGDILFESEEGSLIIQEGAVADVSGGTPVTLYRSESPKDYVKYTAASTPGSITLSFINAEDENGNSLLNGTFIGNKHLATLQGASFSIIHGNEDFVSDEYFSLPAGLMADIENNGFDYLNLVSKTGIELTGNQTITMDRGILIDAPVIAGTGQDNITLNSAWVQLTNTYWPETETGTGSGTLSVNAEFIDITGDIQITGFSNVSLNAQDDIRLTDYQFVKGNETQWSGGLRVDENLVLTAARIYPTTASEFTISAGEKVTILPSGVKRTDPIYSALGSLTIEAKDIEHRGYLAAPMGQIFLSADSEEGRVFLADGSVTTVSGQMAVNYGAIDDENLKWYGEKQNGSDEVESIPEKSIDILGAEVIAEDGSEIDIEGGGAIYGYTFLGGKNGSLDPLSVSGRYVILPYNLADLPGKAIFLEGNELVEEGVYVLLPESYAFIEGALIIEYQGALEPDTVVSKSAEQYVQTVGYMGDVGTLNYSTDAGVYTVRKASDVLSEGDYAMAAITAGDAGSLTAVGTETNILNSKILASALSDQYQGGTLTLIGRDVIVNSISSVLGGSFTFDTQLEDDDNLSKLIGTLYLNAEKISQAGLSKLNVGAREEDLSAKLVETLENEGLISDEGIVAVNTITVEKGTQLEGKQISLIAENDITLETGAGVSATGDSAYVEMVSTDGGILLDLGSHVRSDNMIRLEAQSLERNGEITAAQAIQLVSDKLYLADASHENSVSEGFVIDQALWESFETLDTVWLTGKEEVGFLGNVGLQAGEMVVIDTPLTAGITEDTADITIAADKIYLYNSRDDVTGNDLYAGNTASFTAEANTIYVGYGDTLMSGFEAVNMNAENDLIFLGQGSFQTGNADLNITSAVVTGSYRNYTDENGEEIYEALDFQVDSGEGTTSIQQGTGEALETGNIGGRLTFLGKNIENSGTIDLDSGLVYFSAQDNLTMTETAKVLAQGSRYEDEYGNSSYFDGGAVVYESASGPVTLAQGSQTNVSAHDEGGNAGTVWVSTPNSTADIKGDIKGHALKGEGGTFLLDAATLANAEALTEGFFQVTSDISSLVMGLDMGGSDGAAEEIGIRLREGNAFLSTQKIDESTGKSVYEELFAHNFRLSVDQGSVSIDGIIDASGQEGGGLVEIYAGEHIARDENGAIIYDEDEQIVYVGGDLTLSGNTKIRAKGTGTGAQGGEIILANATIHGGTMNLGSATLDVSGNGGEGGSVYLRVSRNETNNGVNLNPNATFTGADEITVEGVAFYGDEVYSDYKIDSNELQTGDAPYKDANSFMNTTTSVTAEDGTVTQVSLKDALKGTASGDLDGFSLVAGVELYYEDPDGLLQWDDDMDFSNWRFGPDNTPVALTIRSAGDLMIDGEIIDTPTELDDEAMDTLNSEIAQDSTSITLVAGATLSSADPFAVENGVGTLNIDNSEVIYTEGGDINFASGGDTIIERVNRSGTDYMTWNEMKYNLATYTGKIRGKTGGDLILDGGVIQTATGDIDLDIRGNLQQVDRGSSYGIGTIRTIGEPISWPGNQEAAHIYLTADYSNGGNITIKTGGDVLITNTSGKAYIEAITSDAWDTTANIIENWDDISNYTIGWSAKYDGVNATQGIAAMAGGDVIIDAGGDVLTAAGTFGTGDLKITAGGDINGRFLNYEGTAEIESMGSIGTLTDGQVVEVFDSQVVLTAQGNITLASVVNPGITSVTYNDNIHDDGDKFNADGRWNLGYTQDTSVAMTARVGNITLTGTPDQVEDGLGISTTNPNRAHLLPGSLYMSAGKDIVIGANFYLAPSETGSLALYAGGDITNSGSKNDTLMMSDADPDLVYGDQSSEDGTSVKVMQYLTDADEHGSSILHDGGEDDLPAIIQARGSIKNLNFYIPKSVTMTAGEDIKNIYLKAQNVGQNDTTLVYAGNNISFETEKVSSGSRGIIVGGPGLTVVQAGNNIDLGTSLGIHVVGSRLNSLLPRGENNLIVMAGIQDAYDLEYLSDLFEALVEAGSAYAELRAAAEQLKAGVAGTVVNLAYQKLVELDSSYSEKDLTQDEDAFAQACLDEADAIVAKVQSEWIIPLLAGASEDGGNISLINSEIYTAGGSGSIFTIASGAVDVGVSAVTPPPILGLESSDEDTSGIYTQSGGSINIFASSDINVNESRVMTFDGGDIVLWSDYGDINAGYGSKVAVASSDPYYVLQDDGTYDLVYEVPAVGSGVRATAPDIDDAGDIYAFAPNGSIDAGEAGISGKNVTIGAPIIENLANIEASGLTIGFTKPSDASSSVSGLSGSSGLADAAMMDEESSALASAKDRMSEENPEGYSNEPRWVDVEVIGFEEDDEDKG